MSIKGDTVNKRIYIQLRIANVYINYVIRTA